MEGDENDLVNCRKRIGRKKEDLRPRTYYQEVRKVNVQKRMILRKTKIPNNNYYKVKYTEFTVILLQKVFYEQLTSTRHL